MKKYLFLGILVILAITFIGALAGYLYYFGSGSQPVIDPQAHQLKKVLPRNDASDHFTVQLIRHATLLVSTAGKRIIVDPMFSKWGSTPPVPLSSNRIRNPLVPLAVAAEDLVAVDAIIITHNHFDHFDPDAQQRLPKNIPVFCQPADVAVIKAAGFTKVIPIESKYQWQGITISRVGGKHGTGRVGEMMGLVSGFILATKSKKSLYIAGDTIYHRQVEQAIDQFQPTHIIVNAGAAQFIFGDPITMTAADIARLWRYAKSATIIAVHMEAINHCPLTRARLRAFAQAKKIDSRLLIPQDGEILTLK